MSRGAISRCCNRLGLTRCRNLTPSCVLCYVRLLPTSASQILVSGGFLATPAGIALKQTPLYQSHRALGARMVEFAGWEMPVEYSGIVREHLAVRTAAGLFDVSHMGEIDVRGPGALPLLQYVTSNDV